MPIERMVKAERLTGKLSARLEARVAEDIKAVNFDRRYRAEKKTLSVDTPENRIARYRWPVKSVNLVARSELTSEQTGATKAGQDSYWLFELDRPTKLDREKIQDGTSHVVELVDEVV